MPGRIFIKLLSSFSTIRRWKGDYKGLSAIKCCSGLAGIKPGHSTTKDPTSLPKGSRGASWLSVRLTRDRGIAGSRLTGGIALCH